MSQSIKKIVVITFIVVGLIALAFTLTGMMGSLESPRVQQQNLQTQIIRVGQPTSAQQVREQAFQRMIQNMRDRGASETAITRMTQRHQQMMSLNPSDNQSTQGRKPVTTSGSRSTYRVSDIKSIEKFITSAPKIARTQAPIQQQSPTLLVMPFDLDSRWYRNQVIAVNLSELLMAKLNDQSDIRMVDRQQLTEALGEMSLALAMDSGKAMQIGSMLKADLVLRCSVTQDAKADKSQLQMCVIDARRAENLANAQLPIQTSGKGYFNPTEADMEKITQTAKQLLKLAQQARASYAGKTVIAPLFIRNTTDNDRLDHYEVRFRQIIDKLGAQSKTHILKIAGLDNAISEQKLSLTGLAQSDPNAWQYVADQYLWGYFHEEKHPDNTPVDQIPVTITINCWDGANAPVQLNESTTIGQFEQGLEQITSQITSQIQTRRSNEICKGLNAQIALYLSSRANAIPHATRVSSISQQRNLEYHLFLLDLARFFDPGNIDVAIKRGRSGVCNSNHGDNYWQYTCDLISTIEYHKELFEHFAQNQDAGKLITPLRLYIATLTDLARKLQFKPISGNASFSFYRVMNFPPDMPLEGIESIRDRMFQEVSRVPEFMEQIDKHRDQRNTSFNGMQLEMLVKALEQVADDSPRAVEIREAVLKVDQQIKRGQELRRTAYKLRRLQSHPELSKSKPQTKPLPDQPKRARGSIDPKILRRAQNIRDPEKARQYDQYARSRTALLALPPHPALLLDIPQLQAPVFASHHSLPADRSGMHHRSNNKSDLQLACNAEHVWLANGRAYANFEHIQHSSNKLAEKLPHDTVNDMLIYQSKLYMAQKHRGLLVVDLHDGLTSTLGTRNGLLDQSCVQLARVGDSLLISHDDYRLSMLNLSDMHVNERQVKLEHGKASSIKGQTMTACGDWLLLDQKYFFDVRSGKIQQLGSTLRQKLGNRLYTRKTQLPNGQMHVSSDQNITAQQVSADDHAFWLTTSKQLIRLDMNADQSDAWHLPLANPDHIAVTGRYVYMAYSELSWYQTQRDLQRFLWQVNPPMRTHLLVFDAQDKKVCGRMTLPGELQAMQAVDGHIVVVLKRGAQWQLARIITPDPKAQTPYACPEIVTDTSVTGNQIMSLAYAGQVQSILDARPQAMTSKVLTAACDRADTQLLVRLALTLVKHDDDALRVLSEAIFRAAALGRMDLYKQLYAMIHLMPAREFAPDHPNLRVNDFDRKPEQRRWFEQAKFIARLRQIAIDYDRKEIVEVLRAYHLPPLPVVGMWQVTNSDSMFISPVSEAVMRLDRQAFDGMFKGGVSESLLLTVLGSHDPYYLQKLMDDPATKWDSIQFRFQLMSHGFQVNTQRMDELVDWVCRVNEASLTDTVMPLVLQSRNQDQIRKLLTVIRDVNDPKLLAMFIEMKSNALLDLLRQKGWDVSGYALSARQNKSIVCDSRLLNWFIEHGYDLNHADEIGQTLLMKAAQNSGELECFLLLDGGADAGRKDRDGKTAMDMAHEEATRKVIQAYTAMVDQQADEPKPVIAFESKPRPKGFSDYDNAHQLLDASVKNDVQQVMQCLAWGGDMFRSSPYTGRYNSYRSPLMYAASRGQLDITRQLIKAGDPIDRRMATRDGDDWTALMYASTNGHANIVALLLEHHANWQLNNASHQTALDLARLYHHDNVVAVFSKLGLIKKDGRELMRAVMRNNESQLRQMVQQDGYDVNAVDKAGQSALFVAMNLSDNELTKTKFPANFYTNYNMTNVLLDMGADINHQNHYGQTILHRLLQSRFVSYRRDEKHSDESWQNLIDSICEPIRYVLSKGAKPNIADKKGKTVFDLANSNIKDLQIKQTVIQLLESAAN